MKVNVQRYLSPKQRSEFYGNKKAPVARPELKKKSQSEHTTFSDVLKKILGK